MRNPICAKANSSKFVTLYHSIGHKRVIRVQCSDFKSETNTIGGLEADSVPKTDHGSGGDGDNGRFLAGGGGGGGTGSGGGDGDGEEDDYDEKEFGPIMMFEEVIKEAEMRGATLPSDMLEAAKSTGLRRLILTRYLDLQVKCNFVFWA